VGAVIFFYVQAQITKMLNSALNPSPIVRTKPYSFKSKYRAAKVSIGLPDGQGKLIYMHYLNMRGHIVFSSERAIEIVPTKGVTQEWPLADNNLPNTRVGLYWYPAKNGKGPLLGFYDAGGKSFLDFQKREVGEILQVNSRTYLGYYAYNDLEFRSGISQLYDPSAKIMRVVGANDQLATDVTTLVAGSKRTYLGSIVLSGNKLVFVSGKTKTP
jgi:hypothetical protein